jgi:hypothetical protein
LKHAASEQLVAFSGIKHLAAAKHAFTNGHAPVTMALQLLMAEVASVVDKRNDNALQTGSVQSPSKAASQSVAAYAVQVLMSSKLVARTEARRKANVF